MIYVAGAIQGQPGGNERAFSRMRTFLTRHGLDAVTPYSINEDVPANERTLARVFGNDLQIVCKSSCILVLPGSDASQGTLLETAVARYLGIPVVYSDYFASIDACNTLVISNPKGLLDKIAAIQPPEHQPLSAQSA